MLSLLWKARNAAILLWGVLATVFDDLIHRHRNK